MGSRAVIIAQGPCSFCGGPYAAHRGIDGQMERVVAGDSIDAVAGDYGLTVAEMVDLWRALLDLLWEGVTDG